MLGGYQQRLGMNKMNLSFFLEQSMMSKVQLAQLVGTSKQNINDWLVRRDVWVHCDDNYNIEKIVDQQIKVLYEK